MQDGPSREGLRKADLTELREEVARIEHEYEKFNNFKASFIIFTKKMNEISNANAAN